MSSRPDFERVFSVLPNPYMIVDHQLRYVAANDAYLRVTGSRIEDLLGKNVFERFPNDPDDPNNRPMRMLKDSLEKVLATRAPDTLALIPYRVFREAGSSTLSEERFWSATHTPLLDAQGQVEFIVQHTVDVTDLERGKRSHSLEGLAEQAIAAGVLSRAQVVQAANEALDAQRRELLGLFDQAPGFICFLRGKQHQFELANRAYQQLVGGREVVGKTVREALPEVAGQGFYELLDQVFTSGKPHVGESASVRLQRTEGAPPEEVFVDFIYQPVRGRDGEVAGILVQGMDVTARKAAEREKDQARRAAEAFAAEMESQSREVKALLDGALARIQELEARLPRR